MQFGVAEHSTFWKTHQTANPDESMLDGEGFDPGE